MTDGVEEVAFRYAVDRVNANRKILPETRLTAQIERIPPQDSFYASKQGKFQCLLRYSVCTIKMKILRIPLRSEYSMKQI